MDGLLGHAQPACDVPPGPASRTGVVHLQRLQHLDEPAQGYHRGESDLGVGVCRGLAPWRRTGSTGGRGVAAAPAAPDPEVGFAAVVALRGLVEVLEALQVDNARARGWSWRDIARRLGVTKQAVHYKHALRSRGR